MVRPLAQLLRWLHAIRCHLRADGAAVAASFALRAWMRPFARRARDPGERSAERFFRRLGYAVLARNWRSPRDPRDEADLVLAAPDGSEIVIAEVKRAAGPWDALERVDGRKREVLWRILVDLESMRDEREAHGALGRALRRARSIRVDLVGVRGEGRTASVVHHDFCVFMREFIPAHRRGAAQRQ